MKRAAPLKAAKSSQDGEVRQAPWRTLISSVHPNPTGKINYGATFMVTDQSNPADINIAGQ